MIGQYELRTGALLIVRSGNPDDAECYIDYANDVAGQSDFLTFSEGEYACTVESQRKAIEELNDKKKRVISNC